jgi:hypothetical protein
MVRQEHKGELRGNFEPITQVLARCREFALNRGLQALVWIQKAATGDFNVTHRFT